MNPIYDNEFQTLYCGDNCAVMATMPDASIDLVVTSPPYDNLRTYGGHSWQRKLAGAASVSKLMNLTVK